MDGALRLRLGQEDLTVAQEVALERFCDERIEEFLSTAPVDEPAVEARLAQAYTAAGLPPPAEIYWLNGPLELVASWTPPGVLEKVKARLDKRMMERLAPIAHAVAWKSSAAGVWLEVRTRVGVAALAALDEAGMTALKNRVTVNIDARLQAAISSRIGPLVCASVEDPVYSRFNGFADDLYERYGGDLVWSSINSAVRDSIASSEDVRRGAGCAYLAAYYAGNEAEAIDWVSQRLCGYWLGKDLALLVRRPRLLAHDGAGQMHNAAGKCIEFRDGWGFYAWHGVRVPSKVILAPQTLTARDFFRARDLEVRRVIQERLGDRFVLEVGGAIIDSGARGTLYEVELPGDPERVAHYIQVQDASTARQYYLRVPHTVSTVDEAVAWTFWRSADEYHPEQET